MNIVASGMTRGRVCKQRANEFAKHGGHTPEIAQPGHLTRIHLGNLCQMINENRLTIPNNCRIEHDISDYKSKRARVEALCTVGPAVEQG